MKKQPAKRFSATDDSDFQPHKLKWQGGGPRETMSVPKASFSLHCSMLNSDDGGLVCKLTYRKDPQESKNALNLFFELSFLRKESSQLNDNSTLIFFSGFY